MRQPVHRPRMSVTALEGAAECLKVLAHPQRLRLVDLLLDEPRPVGELAEACGILPNVASEHLKLLERCGLLEGKRQGRQVYYEVSEPHLSELLDCMARKFND